MESDANAAKTKLAEAAAAPGAWRAVDWKVTFFFRMLLEGIYFGSALQMSQREHHGDRVQHRCRAHVLAVSCCAVSWLVQITPHDIDTAVSMADS